MASGETSEILLQFQYNLKLCLHSHLIVSLIFYFFLLYYASSRLADVHSHENRIRDSRGHKIPVIRSIAKHISLFEYTK